MSNYPENDNIKSENRLFLKKKTTADVGKYVFKYLLEIYVRQKTRRKKHQKNNAGGQNQSRSDAPRRNDAGIGMEREAESRG